MSTVVVLEPVAPPTLHLRSGDDSAEIPVSSVRIFKDRVSLTQHWRVVVGVEPDVLIFGKLLTAERQELGDVVTRHIGRGQ